MDVILFYFFSVWTGHKENLDKLEDERLIEPPSNMGALGSQSWFIPRKTAVEGAQRIRK